MSYRKNWPTNLAYVACAVVFLGIAAYAVMYGTGYRLDFRNFELIKTGVLAISTKPAGASISIDGKKLSSQTPLTLRNLLPGEYKVELTLAGYRPYLLTTTIESGKATEAHNLEMVLSEITPREIVTTAKSSVANGTTLLYLGEEGQIMKTGEDAPKAFDISKFAELTKKQLLAVTQLNFAKRYADSATWAMSLQIGNRKLLAILDEAGYRGQFLVAPLINVAEDDLMWVDADRMIFLVSGSLYTYDLTRNRTVTYAKDVLEAMYTDGRLTYVTRDKAGQVSIVRDHNPFDDKLAEPFLTDVPVAKAYKLTQIGDDIMLTTDNAGVKGLWLTSNKKQDASAPQFVKLVSNLGYAVNDPENIFYTTGRDLYQYEIETAEEKLIRSFPQAPEVFTMFDESIYLRQENRLLVVDRRGQNAYPVLDLGKESKWLATNGRKAWIANGLKIVELELRTNSAGLFSGLTRWVR